MDYFDIHNTIRVLMLEDSDLDKELIYEKLTMDFSVDLVHVSNKASFIQALENNDPFDIILSDYNLPDTNAFEALKIKQEYNNDIPFICISGIIGEEKAIMLLHKGANDYVLKDRMERLNEAIKNAILKKLHEIELRYAQEKLEQQFEELKIAKEKAEESSRLKTAFLANISHEIRTPMNGIVGFMELLSSNSDQQDKVELYSRMINASVDQLLHIVNSLVDASLVETKQFVIKEEAFFMNKIMEELFHDFESECKAKDIQLSADYNKSEDFELIADRKKVVVALSNIIANAVKFTMNGSVSFGYNVEEDDSVFIYVKDTGIGIEEDNYELIFEKFRKIEGGGMFYGGNGLGLTIAKAYIEALGGTITVQSKVGEGSMFYVSIPSDINEDNTVLKNMYKPRKTE